MDLHECGIADDEGDESGQELRKQLHRERGPCRTYSQFVLNAKLVRFNVLFKFTRKNLSFFGVEALNIRDQRQHGGEDDERDDDGYEHGVLLALFFTTEDTKDREAESLALSISPVGSFNLARSSRSNVAISPVSDSWSWPARWSKPWSKRTLSSVSSECRSIFAL